MAEHIVAIFSTESVAGAKHLIWKMWVFRFGNQALQPQHGRGI